MTVETISVEREKALGDVLDGVADLLKALIVDKKPIADAATAELPHLVTLLGNLNVIGAELKEEALANTVALFGAKLVKSLVLKK